MLEPSRGIKEGSSVKRTGRIASVKQAGLLGRVINTLGEPIDGKGPIQGIFTKYLSSIKLQV